MRIVELGNLWELLLTLCVVWAVWDLGINVWTWNSGMKRHIVLKAKWDTSQKTLIWHSCSNLFREDGGSRWKRKRGILFWINHFQNLCLRSFYLPAAVTLTVLGFRVGPSSCLFLKDSLLDRDLTSHLMFNNRSNLCWLRRWAISRCCPPAGRSRQSGRPCFLPRPARRCSP